MLTVHTIMWGMLHERCYLASTPGCSTCFVVDPGCPAEEVLKTAASLNKTVEAVLITHAHFDHTAGAAGLHEKGIPVYANEADKDLSLQLTKGLLPEYIPYKEGDTFSFGGTEIRVLETPGHSRGSVCLLCKDTLFTGDTLFKDTCGRTDLGCGSRRELQASLRRLMELPDYIRVFPGHGEATTIGAEKSNNPYCH